MKERHGVYRVFHNFMGKLGWELQKRVPNLSADSYLKLQFISRRKSQKGYIDYFNNHEEAPYLLIVSKLTINGYGASS